MRYYLKMINKRGLTPLEFNELDPDLFEMLMVYDTYIEPSGSHLDMLFHAHSCYNTTFNNPNLTNEARKSIKVKDFDFLDILSEGNLTTKEKAEKRDREAKEAQTRNIKAMGEQIKKRIEGKKKNGKQ